MNLAAFGRSARRTVGFVRVPLPGRPGPEPAGLALLCWLLLLLGSSSSAQAGPPVVYLASPEALRTKVSWDISVEGGPKSATIHIRGTHPGQAECVRTPILKMRYNPKKARIKTRQMERIKCATSEQSTTIEPGRRAIEFFINGELTAFIDLEGATRPRTGPVRRPMVLPVDPEPKEPIFIVIPVRADEDGCYRIDKVKTRKRKSSVQVRYRIKTLADCEAERSRFQILARVGPLRKGRYDLIYGDDESIFGVGVEVPQDEVLGEEEEEEPEAPQKAEEAPQKAEEAPQKAEEDEEDRPESPSAQDADAWEIGPEEGEEEEPEDQPEEEPEAQIAEEMEDQPGEKPEDQPGEKPEDQPGEKPEEHPEEKPASDENGQSEPRFKIPFNIDVY